jgi:hypothetical protein
VPLCPPQIPHDLIRPPTRVAEVGSLSYGAASVQRYTVLHVVTNGLSCFFISYILFKSVVSLPVFSGSIFMCLFRQQCLMKSCSIYGRVDKSTQHFCRNTCRESSCECDNGPSHSMNSWETVEGVRSPYETCHWSQSQSWDLNLWPSEHDAAVLPDLFQLSAFLSLFTHFVYNSDF